MSLTNGLVLFAHDTPPAARRRRIVVVGLLLVATAALVWPVYDLFGGVYPLILGLPLSMAWVVFWLFVVFGTILWLYVTEAS